MVNGLDDPERDPDDPGWFDETEAELSYRWRDPLSLEAVNLIDQLAEY